MEATQINGKKVRQPKNNLISQKEKIDLNQFIQDGEGNVLAAKAILKKYAHLQITDSTDIPEPIPVIKIAGETISTKSNVTTISGASKSGKSAFTSVLMAGAISDNDYDGFQDVQVIPNHDHKAVIHIDTEQAKSKHKHNICAILERANLDTCPDYFLSYNIRELPINEYEAATSSIIEAAAAIHDGIFIIVIDGIADYIRDVNDADISNEIVSYLEKIAIKYDCPVITIVHTNPNSDKERGHLGSQLQRKSESVLIIQTDNDISTLKPKFLRSAGKGKIPLIQFRYNPEKHYHEFCGITTNAQADKDAERIEAIKKIAAQVFSGQKAYAYNEAIEAIMRSSNKGKLYSKNAFTEMKAHEMIIQGDDKNWRLRSGMVV